MLTKQVLERAALVSLGVAVGVAACKGLMSRRHDDSEAATVKEEAEKEALRVVFAFLDAQSRRDLDGMCELISDDIVYINEPHPPSRAIRGKAMFRDTFERSPCIWCKDANLELLQHSHNGLTVFTERLDQFFIEGKWIRIPILGYLKVRDGKVAFWKDYWDYAKYKKAVQEDFGPDFKMFRERSAMDTKTA